MSGLGILVIRERPEAERVAVPVPDAGIPRDWVEAARRRTGEKFSSAGGRVRELFGGIAVCVCGRRMVVQNADSGRYIYYLCAAAREAPGRCPECAGRVRAGEFEELVVSFVDGELSQDSDTLTAQIDEAIARERRALRDPEGRTARLTEAVSGCERRLARFQEMYAADAMTLPELKDRLSGLDAEKRLAEEELAGISDAESRLEEMERRKRALLSAFSTGLKLGVFWSPRSFGDSSTSS